MITVKNITVSRFRSIRDARLEDLSNFSVLAGLNNSGKSNFLRAINLFFSGQPEPGINFDFTKDFYRAEREVKKKKTIKISIDFTLDPRFKFRKGLAEAERSLGRTFTITKEWTIQQSDPIIFLNQALVTQEEKLLIEQFLSLISFRYIPNRVIPTELIRREQQALRGVIVRRLAKYKKTAEPIFAHLRKTAGKMASGISSDLTKFSSDIKNVKLATAASLADFAFQSGYLLEDSGTVTDENEQGSGIQSMLLFETLSLIDQDYFQQFGWKQAAIWAVEEPESSLNTALEAQVAYFLSKAASTLDSRLQILATTHSDLVMQYSDKSYYIEKKNAQNKLQTVACAHDMREILELTSVEGVSRWVSPLLLLPLTPLVLVEGKTDKDFLQECFKLMKVVNPPKIMSLSDIFQNATKGGIETLIKFIKENRDIIKQRKRYAKIALLADWDASDKLQQLNSVFMTQDPFVSLSWDGMKANPKLSKSFRGIERFFSDRLISAVQTTMPEKFSTNPSGVISIDKDDSQKIKSELNLIVKKGLMPDDDIFVKPFIEELIRKIQ
jgi:predicted ATPase/5S rRNA maturation endonuclease (ribonuclease M5)